MDGLHAFAQDFDSGRARDGPDKEGGSTPSREHRPSLPPGLSEAFAKHCGISEVALDDELDMSSSSQAPESWISAFCSLVGHEYFAEVSEDFIEDDFNLTGLQSQVPMYKEALEMILDVEPEDLSEEEEEEEEDDDEDEEEMGDDGLGGRGYRRGGVEERRHLRMHSDLSVIESSAEMLYGLIHQRFITSRSGIQQMAEKYELGHFGHCPRVYCNGAKVLPVGCSDIPGQETVKLFCPACLDVYSPPNSRFQTVDGAFFGTTFGCLFFMTFPELDVGGLRPPPPDQQQSPSASSNITINNAATNSSLDNANANSSKAAPGSSISNSSLASAPQLPPPPLGPNATQPETINGVAPRNLAPGLGPGSIFEPRIYGFRVSEVAKTGPRMKWLRGRPVDINELDECRIWAQNQEALSLSRTQSGTEFAPEDDQEMADDEVLENEVDDEEIDDGDMEDEDLGAGPEEPPERQVDGESMQIHEVTQRRKPSRRKNGERLNGGGGGGGPGFVNGEGAGGTAVRVGDGG